MIDKGKHLLFYLITALIMLSSAGTVIAQQAEITVTGASGKGISFQDSTAAVNHIAKSLSDLKIDGYAMASVDTLSDNAYLISPGVRYELGKVKIDSSTQSIMAAAGMYAHEIKAPISQQGLSRLYARLITYLENNGYPYAAIQLDSIHIRESQVDAHLLLDKGEFITIDSINIDSRVKTSPGYIYKYLNIAPGSPFNLRSISRIEEKIDRLSFLEMNGKTSISVYNNTAEINLPLKELPASRFDFLIGIQPTTVDGNQEYSIVGEFTGEMLNALGRGEYFFAKIRRFSADNQELNVKSRYPYILNSDIGASGSFNLFRNGSRFIELKTDIGGFMHINENLTGSLGIDYASSRLIDIDSAYIFRNNTLPPDLDVSRTGIKAGLEVNRLDYLYNPRKGFHVGVDIGVSRKRIIENRSIQNLVVNGLSYAMSYDTVQLNTIQWSGGIMGAYFLPVGSFGTIKLGVDGELLLNNQSIYRNEFFRIGGNKKLRGFDEISIVTDKYIIGTAEFRFLLDRNSFLSLPFIDYGFTHVIVDDIPRWDQAIGGGMGINFSTAIGMFNVSFAVGSRLDNPVNLNNAKIHLGYLSLF